MASRLASAPVEPQHRVLLVEAGEEAEDDPDNLIPGLAVPKFGSEAGNWLYKTTPQQNLNGRTIVYPRGRGLGGSSANNFMSWVRGPKCDFDDWAALTGDDWWRWENVVEMMKSLEDFRPDCPAGKENLVTPTPGMHHHGGPIAVGFGKQWQPLVQHCIDAAVEAGHGLNTDHNDGDPNGVAVAQMNVDNGVRMTSAAAFMGPDARKRLSNLVVVTGTLCNKLVFDSVKTVTGVELISTIAKNLPDIKHPIKVNVEKELVLCAGTFESPHILMLSGIGPAETLASHSIPVVHDSCNVGQHIRDHTALSCEFVVDQSIDGHNQLLQDPKRFEAAIKEFRDHKTGPLGVFGASAAVLFARMPALYESPQFHALSKPVRDFLSNPNRPSTELWMHGGPMMYTGPKLAADASVLVLEGLIQNNLSLGSLTLTSANPRDLPQVDPCYLFEPYDERIAIETVKLILHLADTPAMQSIIRQPIHGPGPVDMEGRLVKLAHADDEDAIKDFIKAHLTQGFHSMGSCVMGSAKQQDRVVDAKFRVLGVHGLRIADMSVCPVLTTNHTQINAYLIAEKCAQVMLEGATVGGE